MKLKNACFGFFIFLAVLWSTMCYAQNSSKLSKITIASPTAASLGKFGDIPVNYHTGIPNIDIPFYTIKTGQLDLPISLSYHASGLKVQEQASWVGAGWALNAGGVITRTVIGAPDDRGHGYSNTLKGHYTDYGYSSYLFGPGPVMCGGTGVACPVGRSGMAPSSYPPQDSYVQTDIFDGEPDLFFYNFNGQVGKFYFNDDRTPVTVPETDLKIEPICATNYNTDIIGFTITTPDGTKYYFGKNVSGDTNIDAVEVTNNISTQANSFTGQGVVSSWYLNKITSPDNQFHIDLSYTAESYSYYTLSMFPIPAVDNPNWYGYNLEYDLNKNFINGVRLSKIKFSEGEINFIAGSSRDDLGVGSSTYNGIDESSAIAVKGTSLGSIEINTSTFCKKYVFSYGYFYDATALHGQLFTQTYPNLNIHTDQYRLRLDAIQEMTCDETKQIPAYNFSYYPGTVPRKLSFAIDHWGFYNGVTSNETLIPTYTIIPQPTGTGTNTSPVTVVQGANRDASAVAMIGGTLQKIMYPTGGSTEFDFEPHKLYTTTTNYVNISLATLSNGYLPGNPYNPSNPPPSRNFIVDPSSSSITISMTSTCSYSSTLVIKDNNGTTVHTEYLGNWDGFTGSNVSTQHTIGIAPGNYTATLYLYSGATTSTTGYVQASINQWQSITTYPTVSIGGLRIKTITKKFNSSFSSDVVTSYGYNFDNNTSSSGKSSAHLYSKPVYVQGLRNDAWGIVNGNLCSSIGCFNCFNSDAAYYKSPSSIRPMATTQGQHIGYGEVYVSQTGNGYSKYQYYSTNGAILHSWDAPAQDVCFKNLSLVCDAGIPNLPAPPESYDPKRGELAAELHYNQAGDLLQQKQYYPQYQIGTLITPGIISKFFITGYVADASNPGGGGSALGDDPEPMNIPISMVPVGIQTFTEYSLRSVKKIQDDVVTTIYTPTIGGAITNTETIYYNSPYHHNPTQMVTHTSKGEDLTTNIKSSFDFWVGVMPLQGDVTSYTANITSDENYLYNTLNSLTTPVTAPNYYKQRLYVYTNYRYMKAIDRQTFIASRLSAANNYTSTHASAKASADNLLNPVLELQDRNINVAIETERRRDSKFLGSSFIQYGYSDPLVAQPYPQSAKAINLSVPTSNFATASISGNTVSKDNRYEEEGKIKIKDGQIVETSERNGPPKSYLYGTTVPKPIAEVMNASSNEIFHENFEEAGSWYPSLTAYDNSKSFTGRKSGYINNSSGSEIVCHSNRIEISLTAAKRYHYSGWVYSDGPSVDIFLFMHRNGEQNTYFSQVDNISTSQANKWVYIEKDFLVPQDMVQLSIRLDNNGGGQVWFDDIRLHPSTSQMTTYTYDPIVGMTSQSDVNGKSAFYEYDEFGRLSIIRDRDHNILKKICYNYAGQIELCNSIGNTLQSGSFTSNCFGGGQVTYTVAANTYYAATQAEANQLAQQDIAQNGQAYADAHGSCVFYNVAMSQTFYKNCGRPLIGTAVDYNVAARTYSASSQAAANQLAQDDINANGQAYAEAHGTCYNPNACSNCTGQDRKCINNLCEEGVLIYTSQTYNGRNHIWTCVYHYEWSDGTWSQNYITTSSSPCF